MVSQFQKANQLQRSGKLEEAVIAYRQAIAQNPDFYWSYHNLGETFCKLERLDEAVEAYQKAVALKPSAACSHLNLAEVLEQQGKEKEAEKLRERAIEIEPRLAGVRSQLEKSVDLGGEEVEVRHHLYNEEKCTKDKELIRVDNLRQENELLLLQLIQTQEELEKYYFQYQSLKN